MTDLTVGDVRPLVQYEADGMQNEFSYPFPILAAGDLVVVLDDGVEPGGHAVTGVGDPEGGSVIFDDPPAAGRRVTLYRDMALARATNFVEAGAFRASALNAELDRLTMMLQQVDFEAGLAVRRAPHDMDEDLTLPDRSERPKTVLGFDEEGRMQAMADPAIAARAAFDSAEAAAASEGNAAASAAAAGESADAAADRAEAARGAAVDAGGSRSAAEQAEAKARKWADEDPDVEVEPGGHSARHWAGKASETVAEVAAELPAERRRGDLAVQRLHWLRAVPDVEALPAWGVDFLLGLGLDALEVTRASTGTYHDARGKLVTAAPDELRVDHDPATGAPLGALVEAERINLLHDSFNPVTQTRNLAAGTYTLSVKGSGSCALSGAASGIASAGAPLTFTLAEAGEVTFTVSGSLAVFQCEDGDSATSFIETPAGGTATRAADNVHAVDLSWLNAEAATLVISAHLADLPVQEASRLVSIEDGEPDRHNLFWNGANNRMLLFTKANGVVQGQLTGMIDGWAPGERHTVGMTFGGGVRKLFAGGLKEGEDSIDEPAPPTLLRLGGFHGTQRWNGHLRRIAVWNRHLSDTDLAALTA